MRYRCRTPTSPDFKDYGGRGINVCDKWNVSFESFLNDVGPRPSASHTLERLNNSEGYIPGNVKWANRTEQQNNTRWNKILVLNGKSRTIAQWSRESGLNAQIIYRRIQRGWTVEKALMKSPQNYKWKGIIKHGNKTP